MSSSLLPKHSFWLGKERLSREIQFVMVSLTLRYLPGTFFKTRLHQLKPTALPCCEHGKCSTQATLLPSLCDCPISLSLSAKHLYPSLCLPAGFLHPYNAAVPRPQPRGCCLPSEQQDGFRERSDALMPIHFSLAFPRCSVCQQGHILIIIIVLSCWRAHRADTQCPLPLVSNWGW